MEIELEQYSRVGSLFGFDPNIDGAVIEHVLVYISDGSDPQKLVGLSCVQLQGEYVFGGDAEILGMVLFEFVVVDVVEYEV